MQSCDKLYTNFIDTENCDYKASPHPNVRFFFIYHKPDRNFAVKTLYKYFTEGYKSPEGYLYFKPLKTYIKQPFLIDKDKKEVEQTNRTRIGFKQENE